ncbi:MAG: peptidase S10 [Acidobacteriota bacterium]|nr:peptidase S10 [Acidobacteriota bacterium]
MRGHKPAELKTKRSALKTKCPAFETKCRAALTAVALVLCALAATPAPAQTRAPISKENVVAFLRGLAPERRDAGLQMLAAAMRDSGVDFEVTPAVEQELRDAGATSELVAAARANFRPAGMALSQAPSASPSSPPQTPPGARGGATPSATPVERDPAMQDLPPVVTKHEIRIGGRALRYTVTTGVMPLRNIAGETEARIFYMAYTLDGVGDRSQRPLMFSFNGGPGSASVWLHMGALGPRRVQMLDDGQMPPPPYRLVDNESTWLDFTDLVFIDPVGTGYSRAAKPELGSKYFGLQGDIQSVGEFIRLYLARNERWTSPLFLVGESYGTTRAAGLSGYLVEHGIAFNGIILISTIMNFQTTNFGKGNDLPYVLFLPTYTAIAWYHKKLPPDLQTDLRKTLDEVERWAATDYTIALAKGDRLTPSERQEVIDRLNRYTGLDKRFIDQSDLRIEIQRFDKELLRDERRTVGRLDGRFKGIDALAVSERPDFDPSLAAIRPPYTATFNNYVRSELGFRSDLEYYILGGGIGRWDFGAENSYADTSEALRSAFAKNPYMRLMVACGYYDLATPYFAAQYTLKHMGLDPSLRDHVTLSYYEAGHMVYIDKNSLAQLKRNAADFVQGALANRGR